MPVRMKDVPQPDRPRERLWRSGPGSLSDAELVALVLRSGHPGESAMGLATRMLADFGGVQELGHAEPEELAAYPGVGAAKAATLTAALHLANRAARTVHKPTPIRRPDHLAAIATEELKGAQREHVITLVLDSGYRLKRVVSISEGSIDRSFFPVREILNAVLRNDGRTFAVAHNHPSGDPSPSTNDHEATLRLFQAAQLTGLRFLDHIIIGDGRWMNVPPTSSGRRHR